MFRLLKMHRKKTSKKNVAYLMAGGEKQLLLNETKNLAKLRIFVAQPKRSVLGEELTPKK